MFRWLLRLLGKPGYTCDICRNPLYIGRIAESSKDETVKEYVNRMLRNSPLNADVAYYVYDIISWIEAREKHAVQKYIDTDLAQQKNSK